MRKKELLTPFSTRQYMLSKDFEVYYYSDKPGNAVSSHTHDYYEFYFFLEGNVCLHVDNKKYYIQSGDFLLIPPGVAHYPEFLDEETPYRRFILWLSDSYYRNICNMSSDLSYLILNFQKTNEYSYHCDPLQFNRIQARIFELIEEIKSNRFGRDTQISFCINSLLLYLSRILYESQHGTGESRDVDLAVAISEYINHHLEEDLSLDAIQKEFFVSKFHISHTFTEEFGISIHQYITKKRLQACRDAILGGMSISKTYELYGFNDYSSFFRAFKKEYSVSPKEFRELHL